MLNLQAVEFSLTCFPFFVNGVEDSPNKLQDIGSLSRETADNITTCRT